MKAPMHIHAINVICVVKPGALKKLAFLFVLLLFGVDLDAQIGGRYAFESVSLPLNARLTALGGQHISVKDEDVALAFQNPAVSNPTMDMQLSVNHNFHFAGISHGNVLFGKQIDSLGMSFHAGISYVDYGDFTAANELGDNTGEFSAGEMAVTVGAAKQLNARIRGGINLKFLSSNYESYGSVAVGVDLGLFYQTPGSNTAWSLVIANIGHELSAVVDDKRGLPFNLQMAFSRRLEHLPFRFSIVAQQLQKWYIRYDDPDRDVRTDFLGDTQEISAFSRGLDNFFRHFVFNGEFLIGTNEQFRLRFAYNHLRRQEMSLSNFRSLAGFSFGLGINIKKIRFDYGVGYHHLAGATNHLSLRINMARIFNKI